MTAYIDSLKDIGVEDVFTLGRGGNAPQDPVEKMDAVFRGGFRNPAAEQVHEDARRWGRAVRWVFRDLGEPLITRIEIHKGIHTARWFHDEQLLYETPVAVGNPEIGKGTPEGSYHVLYVDFRPISRWKRTNVPYGHEYNPYGSRQIPFYKDWTMHGNNDPSALGKNISKGCVRMHNAEMLALAELVKAVKTEVVVLP
ncbi:MAG: L,D-transpeptidase [bacterium]